MSTPSSADDKPQARKRDLRDSAWFKLGAFLAVLAVAFLATRSCAARGDEIDKDEAIAIARAEVDFEPEDVQVRYLQRGVPPRGFWAVSLYTTDENGRPLRVRVVVVDASSGEVSAAPAANWRM